MNLEAIVVQEIDKAQTRILLQQYYLSNTKVADALVRAMAERKVVVNIILDSTQEADANTQAVYLKRMGAHIVSDFISGIAHTKITIIDTTEVLGGSPNFSGDGLTQNAENLLILRDPDVLQRFVANFDARVADPKTKNFNYRGGSVVKRP